VAADPSYFGDHVYRFGRGGDREGKKGVMYADVKKVLFSGQGERKKYKAEGKRGGLDPWGCDAEERTKEASGESSSLQESRWGVMEGGDSVLSRGP